MWMIMYLDDDVYKIIVENTIITTCDIICITKDRKMTPISRTQDG